MDGLISNGFEAAKLQVYHLIQFNVVTFAENLYEYSVSKVIPQIELVRLILQHETWGKLVQIFTKQTNVNLPGSAATVDVL